ncbi:hypothetical protein FQN53_008999 [Emmonsiellopsis sp. PD_33]|nr:hypothetical protein FQN53_008999 [Emmonsiellopsis sp. PD_33]
MKASEKLWRIFMDDGLCKEAVFKDVSSSDREGEGEIVSMGETAHISTDFIARIQGIIPASTSTSSKPKTLTPLQSHLSKLRTAFLALDAQSGTLTAEEH